MLGLFAFVEGVFEGAFAMLNLVSLFNRNSK
jgi:hypothetical protein